MTNFIVIFPPRAGMRAAKAVTARLGIPRCAPAMTLVLFLCLYILTLSRDCPQSIQLKLLFFISTHLREVGKKPPLTEQINATQLSKGNVV